MLSIFLVFLFNLLLQISNTVFLLYLSSKFLTFTLITFLLVIRVKNRKKNDILQPCLFAGKHYTEEIPRISEDLEGL